MIDDILHRLHFEMTSCVTMPLPFEYSSIVSGRQPDKIPAISLFHFTPVVALGVNHYKPSQAALPITQYIIGERQLIKKWPPMAFLLMQRWRIDVSFNTIFYYIYRSCERFDYDSLSSGAPILAR